MNISDKLFISFVFGLIVLISCVPENPEIHVACEKDPEGNYLLKWETLPPMDGSVKIYQSAFSDSFVMQTPVAEQEIKMGFITSIPPMHNKKRSYFQLVFNKKRTIVTAERSLTADAIYNLRDIGGYFSKDYRQTKWGQVYRSSSLSVVTKKDIEVLNNLKIKTAIDLRTDEEIRMEPSKYTVSQTFNLPLSSINPFSFYDKIVMEEMLKGDIIIKLQDIHIDILKNNSEHFVQLFDILLEKKNYPVILFCTLGKDRVGIVMALLFAALNIPKDQIVQDYMLSNHYIEFDQLVPNAAQFSLEVQEALTAFFSSNEQTINYVFERINKDYGSVDNYFEKELKLSRKKREILKELLLYPRID